MVQTRAIRRRCDFIATRLCEIVRRAPEEGFGIYDPVYWREWHDHLYEAMRDPTVDALVQSLFWVAYLLSEEVVAYEYVVIRQAFIEGIIHYGTFEEVEWSVNMLYFQFIEWEFMQPPFAIAVPWQQELMPYED
jgi:hypothetical protein